MPATARRHLPIYLMAIALSAACAKTSASPAQKLRVTAIPDANMDTLREDQARIVAWLSGRVGVPVEFLPVENYAAAVTALVSGQAELGWLGGVTAVQAMT